MIFYTLIFAAVAILAIAAGFTYMSRNRRRLATEEHQATHSARSDRSKTKARRAQSVKDRRKRH